MSQKTSSERNYLGTATALSAFTACGVLFASNAFAGDVAGAVKNQNGSQALAGAVVNIPGTNYSTKTAADGSFTLKDVPAGRYNVEVYASGYTIGGATLNVPATGEVTQNFVAYPSTTVETVVVATNRFTAKQDEFESPQPISVLSASDLEQTAVHNAAEVVGLMPSVNVMKTGNGFFGGIDGAARGEGQFVSIRSLDGEYNVNLINGIDVAEAQPYTRAVQLNQLPPSGLHTVVLSKTSTPDMDGDAIGGTLNFVMPTAFDFASDHQGSISVSGNFETQAYDLKQNGAGFGANGEYEMKFGSNDDFGVYISGYYARRNFANSELGGIMEAAGGDQAYALSYVDANGNIPSYMNPIQDVVLAGFNVGASQGEETMFGGTLSIDWRPNENHTYYIHATYGDEFTTQNTIVNQIVGEGMVRQQGTSPLDSHGNVLPGYIAAGNGLYQTTIPYVSNRLWYETNPERSDLDTVVAGTHQGFGNWHVDPSVFYSFGKGDRPRHIELWTTSIPTGLHSAQAAPFGSPTLVTYSAGGFPVAHLTPDMNYAAENPGTMPGPCCYEQTTGISHQNLYGVKVDAGYDFDSGMLKKIDFGAKYVRRDHYANQFDWTVSDPSPATTFAADTSLTVGYYPGFPGHYDYPLPVISHAVALARFNSMTSTPALLNAASDVCTGGNTAVGIETNNYCNALYATERKAATYALADLGNDVWNLEFGARYEHTDIPTKFWVRVWDTSGNEVLGHWGSNTSTFDEFLPSAFLSYRPDDNSVYRADIWTSYTLPPYYQLGGSAQSTYDPTTNTYQLRQGNPNLKAIRALNFDLDAGWSTDTGGYYSIGVFRKDLSHYIYDSGASYINGVTGYSGGVQITQPENGGNGTAQGIELSWQQRFSYMPAPFDGISIGGNFALMSSRVDLGTTWGRRERIQNAPNVTGNLGIYYSKGGISFAITDQYEGSYVAQYDELGQGASWDDEWMRPTNFVNLNAGYTYGQAHIEVSVANLLKAYDYWSHVGHDSLAISDIVQSGRTILVTMKYNL